MSRFVALYRTPTDGTVESFLSAYRDTHLPLVARTPGLVGVEISRVRRTLTGEPELLMMAVLTFADAAAYKSAMASPEWAQAGRNLAEIGGTALATMFTLEDPQTLDLTAS